jgi:membrane protein
MRGARAFASLLKGAGLRWVEDRASSMGAAIAYYTMLSLAPLMLIVITVAGLFFGETAARDALLSQAASLVGENGAQALDAILTSSSTVGGGAVSILIGVLTLVVGATTVFGELQSDLDVIWRASESAKQGWRGLLRVRLLSFGLILAVGFLITVSLVLSAVIAAFGSFWASWFQGASVVLQALNFALGFGFITALFALIYKLLPSVPIAWGDVWIGAACTSMLFSIGKSLIGLYLGKTALSSSFGAAGTLVVVVVWVYYSAQIFLLGAEFTYLYATRYGSRAHRTPRWAEAQGLA